MSEKQAKDICSQIAANELESRLWDELSKFRKQSPRAALAVEAFILFRLAGFQRNTIKRLQNCRSATITARIEEVTVYLEDKLRDFRE